MPDIKTEHLIVEGRCLCGGVKYRVEGERSGIIVCHCQRCRKRTGAAFVGFVIFESGEFDSFTGDQMLVSNVGPGCFCGTCGTCMPKPPGGDNKALTGILAGHILDMPPVALIYHFYTDSKCPWIEIPSDVHQWDTVAPDFTDPGLDDLQRYTEQGKITGSCLCGDVAFEATEPIMMMNCHCSRCRLSRGAAHATNLFVSTENFHWRSGEEAVVNYKLPGAERFGTAFCQRCGSLVPRITGTEGERVNIPAGCLDCDPGIKPQGHIFVASKAPWFDITDSLPQWENGYSTA